MVVLDSKKIVLIGGGGHCYSVIDTLQRLNIYQEIAITDPNEPEGTELLGCKVCGNDDNLRELYQNGFTEAFITVGSIKSTALRQQIRNSIENIGFRFPTIIDPSAIVSDHSQIGRGVFIGKNSIVNAGAKVADFAIINSGSIIEHRCCIGEFSHIAVGAVICGDAMIGDRCLIGANSTVLQCLTVGSDVIVGAGSVVLKNVPDRQKVIGVWK